MSWNSCGAAPWLVTASSMRNVSDPGTVETSAASSSLGPKNDRSWTTPADADPMRRRAIDDDLHLRRRDVADLAVERQVHLGLGPGVVDELIPPGVAGELQPAADQPLVEAFEPAQAAPALQVDELGMHHLLDRRIPAQPQVARAHLEDAHAPRRDQRDRQLAVVDRDQLDPFLLAPVEDGLADRPGAGLEPGRSRCPSENARSRRFVLRAGEHEADTAASGLRLRPPRPRPRGAKPADPGSRSAHVARMGRTPQQTAARSHRRSARVRRRRSLRASPASRRGRRPPRSST